ncbi:glutathione S-transferase kappa 1-like isoform X2 [Rhineura floridana]|uniref:glutathione S-transferase kappa 1-like isoform X2 n=1 Tax=Rhineura floridana TaxID=261503 RepID=UPI002AC800BE|nr:glutathione S-transferase kappa 1-like isoform X2 [Rhineura floridana]
MAEHLPSVQKVPGLSRKGGGKLPSEALESSSQIGVESTTFLGTTLSISAYIENERLKNERNELPLGVSSEQASSAYSLSCDSGAEHKRKGKGQRPPKAPRRRVKSSRVFVGLCSAPALASHRLRMTFLLQARRSLLCGLANPRRSMVAAARQGLGSHKKVVDLFYDVVSPYSWFGFEVLCRYRPIWNMELRFQPVFLGGIMKATGNQTPAMVPKKGQYMSKDLMRVAKFYQVPICLMKDFFGTVLEKGSLPAMRFVTAVDITEPQFLESVSRELWMRIWSRDEDITQPESILAATERAGLPLDKARKLLEMSTSSEVKNHLKAATDEAVRYGVHVHCIKVDR